MKIAALLPVVALTCVLTGCGSSPERTLQVLSSLGYEFQVDDYLKAAADGDLRAVQLFQTAGMKVDVHNAFLDTALIRASRGGHLEVVDQLLSSGAQINHAGRNGRSALIHACDRGYRTIADHLLLHGADPSAEDDKDWNPLTMAAYRGHEELVTLLVPYCADSLDEALLAAAAGGNVAVVERLIKSGASMKVTNGVGNTPLLIAASNGNVGVCDMLLRYGADPMERDHNGDTASYIAEIQGYPKLAEKLMDATRDLMESTPVHQPEATYAVADYAGAMPKALSKPQPGPIMPADGLSLRLPQMREKESVIPKPLLRDQWPSLEGKVLRLNEPLGDADLGEVFALREFNYEPALLTFLGVEHGKAVVQLANEEAPRHLMRGDRIPLTSMEVARIVPRVQKSDSEIYEDRSELVVRDMLTGVRRTLVFGETRDEGSPYAVLSIGGSNQQQYWARPGHSFTLLRPGIGAQDYQVVAVRPSKLEIRNVASEEVIPITRQGMARKRQKENEPWTLGFFR